MNLFKRKPKEETVSKVAYDNMCSLAARLEMERNSYREDALKYRANIARLHAANARRKAQARDKQQAGEVVA